LTAPRAVSYYSALFMKTSDFDYELPRDLIAQYPAARRDEARMMVVHRSENRIEHAVFSDLETYLESGDLIVLNDTKVIPARVFGKKAVSGGKVEFLLLEETQPGIWDVLMKANNRPAVGSAVTLADGDATAYILDDKELGRATIRIESEKPWMEILDRIGIPPLPPYIMRDDVTQEELERDRMRYQTVYAQKPGAVAAPTAGLHFTPERFESLAAKGIQKTAVTLHVGLGTFRPVEVETIEDHEMEKERYSVSEETAHAIEATQKHDGRIMAVGTTSVRTLESVAAKYGRIVPSEGRTNLFIYPYFEFKVVDIMLTNFHLPRSTLIMMLCAFGGRELIMHAYNEAVKERYRFYSYGDCMLVI